MIRKLFLVLMLVGISFIATSSSSAPLECEPEPVNPCDVVCGEDGPDVCDCPCWTDRRVEQSTCATWNSIVGCWYF